MATLQGQPAELRMTIEVKRAATGLTETYQLVGVTDMKTAQQLTGTVEQEQENGSNTQHGE